MGGCKSKPEIVENAQNESDKLDDRDSEMSDASPPNAALTPETEGGNENVEGVPIIRVSEDDDAPENKEDEERKGEVVHDEVSNASASEEKPKKGKKKEKKEKKERRSSSRSKDKKSKAAERDEPSPAAPSPATPSATVLEVAIVGARGLPAPSFLAAAYPYVIARAALGDRPYPRPGEAHRTHASRLSPGGACGWPEEGFWLKLPPPGPARAELELTLELWSSGGIVGLGDALLGTVRVVGAEALQEGAPAPRFHALVGEGAATG